MWKFVCIKIINYLYLKISYSVYNISVQPAELLINYISDDKFPSDCTVYTDLKLPLQLSKPGRDTFHCFSDCKMSLLHNTSLTKSYRFVSTDKTKGRLNPSVTGH